MDKILIQELEVQMHIGCSQEERHLDQRIVVNLEIGVDARAAAESKRLDDTVCYLDASKLVEEIAHSKNWVLIEEFAEEVSEQVFKTFPRAQALKLEIRKFRVPHVRWTGLIIERSAMSLRGV